MKKATSLVAAWAGFLAVALVTPVLSATVEKQFNYGPERLSIVNRAGLTEVEFAGASRDFTPGHPDLPMVGEMVDLPPDAMVTGVEVVDLKTELLLASARLPSAIKPTPGLGPIQRSDPDPAFFGHSGFQPQQLVTVGTQGWMRGRHVAALQLSPVRWDAVSGSLERVVSMRVRLTLAPSTDRDLPRQRIVREWEDTLPSGIPTRELGAALVSLATTDRHAQPFRPTQVPSVLGSPVAYVIITNDAMAPTYQQLADWKTQTGVPAVVRTLSFIQQNYPGAADDAERVRLFIRDCYTRWGTRWVLLGGDTDVMPVRYARTEFYGGENIASDLYYSCLNGNWDANRDSLYGQAYVSADDPGDSVDMMPEVYVGRSPSVTPAQAQLFVNKCLQYEKTPAGDYENGILMFAEVLFPQNWSTGVPTSLDGAELTEELLPSFNAMPCVHYARLYENYTDPRWVPGAIQEYKSRVIDSLNVGYNISIHVGHGYRNVMSVGDQNLINSDALALHNGNRLTNLYATDCTSNAIDFPCIGEAFLLAPNGGAVTNIGSSRFDFPTAGRAFQREYFRLLYEDTVTAIGELQARQKLPFISFSTLDGVNRWTELTLLLLGDPELHIYRCRPRTLNVTCPASITLSDTLIAVNVQTGGVPLANARVTAYKPGDDLRTVVTNGSGNANVPFHPDSLGNLTMTVTAIDSRAYQTTISITGTLLPMISGKTPLIDDDNLGGTSGNGNGVIDAGEVVDLTIPVRNNGGATDTGVTGTLTITDPQVTVTNAVVNYGTVGVGLQVSGGAYRIHLPFTVPDQRELPFRLVVTDAGGRTFIQSFQLTVHAPDLKHFSHIISDVGGNNNGRPDPGETVSYFVKLKNMGTGVAGQVTGKLRSYDGLAVVSDSTSSFGDLAPGAEVPGDAFVFVPSSANAQLTLIVSDNYGIIFTQTLDLGYPTNPISVQATGASTTAQITWFETPTPDLLGFNVYRSPTQGSGYVKVNSVPTDKIAYYLDSGLTPLTKYFYKVAAVDQSGNESSLSLPASVILNPPNHAIFPIPMGGLDSTPSSVAIDKIYQGNMFDIVAGAEKLYVIHADGTAPVDADGQGTTVGDFTLRGSYFAAGPSIADIDGGGADIIAPSWGTQLDPVTVGDSMFVFVFDKQGNTKPGWPVATANSVWSSVAVGEIDGNTSNGKELVFASNGPNFYAFHADGSELLDGDNNPATKGVFKVLGSYFNFGTPALADLDGDGRLDIIYGSYDGYLYAWRWNGTNLPGFPIYVGGQISASAAVGYLDGPGDNQLEIVIASNTDSLYVFEANGARRPGWPVWIRSSGNSKTPSPAIADMNGDGFNDIVFASNNGGIYIYNRDGSVIRANMRYSLFASAASESSPVVADIDGDGIPDVVMGDENGQLTALSGATGLTLPGFPIQLDGEVKGTPAVCDCSGSGKTEIVLADWDKNLYVWDYGFPFSPNQTPPWPQFHHDAARTGLATNPPFVGVPGESPTQPSTLEFAAPSPNPARTQARMWFSVPAGRDGESYELAVFDLSGRRVEMLDRGVARVGRHSAAWDLRESGGSPARNGIYFMRLDLGSTHLSRKLVVIH